MLFRKQMLKKLNKLNKEVRIGMKEDEKKFDELKSAKPKVYLEVRKFNRHEK